MAHATIDLTDPARPRAPSLPSIDGSEDLRHHPRFETALSNASKTLQARPVSKASLEFQVPLWWHLCGRSQLAVSLYRKS